LFAFFSLCSFSKPSKEPTSHGLNHRKIQTFEKKVEWKAPEIKDLRWVSTADPENLLSDTRDELNSAISEILEKFQDFETQKRSSHSNQSLDTLEEQHSLELGRLHLMWAKILFQHWELNQLVPSGPVNFPGVPTF